MMKKGLTRLLVYFCLVGAVLGGAGFWLYMERNLVSTDDAMVDGRIFTVSARVAGYVTDVPVQDNQPVTLGETLVRLDPTDYHLAYVQARADLGSTHQDASAAEDALAEAKANDKIARLTLERMKNLVATGAISREKFDQVQAKASVADGKVREAQARLQALVEKENKAQQSILAAKMAKVTQARLNVKHCEIQAPASGMVAKRAVNPGSFVHIGEPLMSVISLEPPDIWITANFKETQIAHISKGQPVTIAVDAYPHHTYHGVVESLQAGTGAAFSLFPPENALGNYVKVLQRVPVRIRLVDYDPKKDPLLRIGLNVEPTINVSNATRE